MTHSEIFGNRIRILRGQHKLTQKALAEKLGIPKSTLAGYENGIRAPKFDVLEKLAKTLYTTSDYLIGITDDPTPSKPSKNLKTLLVSDDYHIDGKKLSNDDLKAVIDFLERFAQYNDTLVHHTDDKKNTDD